jgi:hypothetical protein
MALDLASISIEGRVSDTKFTRLSLQANEDGGLVSNKFRDSCENVYTEGVRAAMGRPI